MKTKEWKSRDRQILCAHCRLNDNANCRLMPECPLNTCEFCHKPGHSLEGCPELARELISTVYRMLDEPNRC